MSRPIKETEKEDLRILLQTKVADIAFFKSHTWQATNYAVLTYIAIVGAAGLAETIGHCLRPLEIYVGMALAILSATAALCTVESLYSSLRATRECVDETISFLSSTFRKCYNVKWARVNQKRRDWPFPHLFRLYIVIGAILTCLILGNWF